MGIFSFFGCKSSGDPAAWSEKETNKWFDKGEWLKGLKAVPDPSIDRAAFTVAYFKNVEKWNKAFAFLKDNDLTKLSPGRHEIDGENLYAMVNEYTTLDPEKALFEAHRKYIDIQYMVTGKELIKLAPLNAKSEVTRQFDPANDYELFNVKESQTLKALSGRFFIFFPDDAHSPGIKDGENVPVRKVVVKVKVD